MVEVYSSDSHTHSVCLAWFCAVAGVTSKKGRVLFAFFVIASTLWFQDSLLFTPKTSVLQC